MAGKSTDQLYAVVDMGSNAIRLSISTLEQPVTRSLPTVYQSRLGISLYDVQYSNGQKVPIPQETITTVVTALKRFKQTSLDFGVPQREENVRILATEATRNAINSAEYISAIENAMGEPWKVDLLKKEDEGRIGALGVASSVGGSAGLEGLVMDLGGGSTQITWLIARPGEELQTSPIGSISFPYGAAAMTRLLDDISTDTKTDAETARSDLRTTMVAQFRTALHDLALPHDLRHQAKHRGLTLYLSGGGFRGWGYLLMSSHRIRPYPIPIINGFCAPVKDFKDTDLVTNLALQSLQDKSNDKPNVFRVSERRATQVPAVSFLIDALTEAIPTIQTIRFCQGGVREGYLFNQLPLSIRAEDPLVAATARFANDLASTAHFADLLAAALPPDCPVLDRVTPPSIKDAHLLQGIANLIFLQQGQSKESTAVNALHVPITGVLASSHGIGHQERAIIALALCQRWGGESALPAPHDELAARLALLLTNQEVWWARYLGVVAACIGEVYPAGRMRGGDGSKRIGLSAKWSGGLGKKGHLQGVVVRMTLLRDRDEGGEADILNEDSIREIVDMIEVMGKKKNRVGGKEYGFGVSLRVDVDVVGE